MGPDNSTAYWAMKERAEEIRSDLESLINRHGGDRGYWDKIVAKYDLWLRQEEDAAKNPCIENDHAAAYTESETLFQILAERGQHRNAEKFVVRLTALKHYKAKEKWLAAIGIHPIETLYQDVCPVCGISRRDLSKPCSICGSLGKRSLAKPATTPSKPCPYCKEPILPDAKKCKHCGEYLDANLRKANQKTAPKPKGEGCFLQTMNAGCLIVVIIIVLVVFFVANVSKQ